MTTVDPVRRRLVLALALLPAACAAPNLITAPVAPPPQPVIRAGDRWRYLPFNGYNGESGSPVMHVVEAERPQLRVRIVGVDNLPRPDEINSRAWSVWQEPTYDFLQLFADPVPLLPRDLTIGATEKLQTRFRVPDRYGEFDWQIWATPVAWEKVAVPAGSFDCLHIERRIWFTHPDDARYRSQRRDDIWYAPSVNRWVQRAWSGTYLHRYSPRQPPGREDWVITKLMEYVPSPIG